MKKCLILLLALCLLLSLCACGNSQSGNAPEPPTSEGSSEFGNTASPAEPPASTEAAPSPVQETPEPAMSTGKVPEAEENLSRIVSFDPGGGSGTMNPVSIQVNTEYPLPDSAFTAPEGKVFLGWQEPGGTETKKPGTKIRITGDVTLKAVWIGRWAALQAQIEAAKSGDVIKLTGNTVAAAGDSALTLNKSVTIDLGGFTLDRGKAGPVMEIKAGEVVLTDSSSAQTGNITGGVSGGAGGAISVSDASAVLTINGGSITGNSAKTGGAIYNAGTVVLNGGAIRGNAASEDYGGAIFNQGKLTINGGSITDNTCGGDGGALWSEKELVITGGAIRNNKAGKNGGGIYLYYGTLTVSGSPVVQDNSAGKNAAANNVYLAAGTVTVGGKLADSARIGVSAASAPASGAPVTITGKLSGNGTAANFFSDNGAYAIGTGSTGDATLCIPSASVIFQAGEGTGKMETVGAEIGSSYQLPESKFTPPNGKEFAGWQIGGKTYQKGERVTISADTTATALWKAAAITPSPSPSNAAPASPSTAPVSPAPASPSPEEAPAVSPEEPPSPSPEEAPAVSPEEPPSPSPEDAAEISPEEPAPEEAAEVSPEEPVQEESTETEPETEPEAQPEPETEPEPASSELEPVPASVKITFDAGGGTGKMEAVSLEPGSKYKLPECKFTPPEGKAFAGWLIGKPGETPMPDGAAKTDMHQKDEAVVIDADTVLKAQWKDAKVEEQPSETGSVFGGGGGIAAVAVVILLGGAAAAAVLIKKKKA